MAEVLQELIRLAAPNDGNSERSSHTTLTARTRTSGQKLFDLFMAQSSQRVEPLENPWRFNTVSRPRLSQSDLQAMYDSRHAYPKSKTDAQLRAPMFRRVARVPPQSLPRVETNHSAYAMHQHEPKT